MDLIRCAYILDTDYLKPDSIVTPVLQHMDGSPVSPNELVDIGGDRWKYKYPVPTNNIFSWNIKSYTPDIPDKYHQQRALALSYRTMALLMKQNYRFTRDPIANFTHEFMPDAHVFSGPTVLAHAYLYFNGMPKDKRGLIQYNDSVHAYTPYGDSLPAYLLDNVHYSKDDLNPDGSYVTLQTQPLIHINMHEGKHAHGYRHDKNSPKSLLYPYVKRGYSVARKFFPNGLNTEGRINKDAYTWTEDDILRWGEGYELRNLEDLKLDYFRERRYRGKFVPEVLYRVPT